MYYGNEIVFDIKRVSQTDSEISNYSFSSNSSQIADMDVNVDYQKKNDDPKKKKSQLLTN